MFWAPGGVMLGGLYCLTVLSLKMSRVGLKLKKIL